MEQRSEDLYLKTKDLIMSCREWSLAEGAINSKHKALIAAAVFISQRCEPCIKAYLTVAAEWGASKEETRDMCNVVAMSMGCLGDVWADKAYHFFCDLADGKIDKEVLMQDVCDSVNLISV